MEVLAKKSGAYAGFAVLCAIGTAIIIGVTIVLFRYMEPKHYGLAALSIPVMILCICAFIYCVKIASRPENLIYLDSDSIKLYDGRIIKLTDISDVSYKHASSKYGTYGFGKIILNLSSGEAVKIYPVAELDEVGKKLSRLIYGKANND